jgi:hypothetical protein
MRCQEIEVTESASGAYSMRRPRKNARHGVIAPHESRSPHVVPRRAGSLVVPWRLRPEGRREQAGRRRRRSGAQKSASSGVQTPDMAQREVSPAAFLLLHLVRLARLVSGYPLSCQPKTPTRCSIKCHSRSFYSAATNHLLSNCCRPTRRARAPPSPAAGR